MYNKSKRLSIKSNSAFFIYPTCEVAKVSIYKKTDTML